MNQAIDPDALVAADSVVAYCEALGSSLKQLGSVRAWPKGQVYGEELVQALSNFESIMVVGPSGCGKSFHLSHAVLRAMESDEAPIVVRPKWYRGAEFWTLLQRAIAPYHRGSVKSFLSNVLTCGKQPLLVVDGLNECSSDLIDDLHHGIRGFLTQFGGRLLIAGRSKSGLFSELAVRVLDVCLRLSRSVRFMNATPPIRRTKVSLRISRMPMMSSSPQSVLEVTKYASSRSSI